MLKRKWVAAKLFAVVGGAGLAFGICVPRASAQGITPGSFSNANYLNRYTCNETALFSQLTAQMTLFPDGTGSFKAGTMLQPADFFSGTSFDPTMGPSGNFCSYTLNVSPGSGSTYTCGSDGVCTEVLSWTPATTNPTGCGVTATFLQSDTFVMRSNGARPSGAVVRTEQTIDNLADDGDSGSGHCLK